VRAKNVIAQTLCVPEPQASLLTGVLLGEGACIPKGCPKAKGGYIRLMRPIPGAVTGSTGLHQVSVFKAIRWLSAHLRAGFIRQNLATTRKLSCHST
jgi:hypothetical protein